MLIPHKPIELIPSFPCLHVKIRVLGSFDEWTDTDVYMSLPATIYSWLDT